MCAKSGRPKILLGVSGLVGVMSIGLAVLAGPGLREALTFTSEGFASMELELAFAGDPLSTAFSGRWEGMGFAYGEVEGSLRLEPLSLSAGLGLDVAGPWTVDVGAELRGDVLSTSALLSLGPEGVKGWGVEARWDGDFLSLAGAIVWEGSFTASAAAYLSSAPLSLGAELLFSQGEGLSRIRGGIGITGDLGEVGFGAIWEPPAREILISTEFDLKSEHLSFGFVAVWDPTPEGELRPAAAAENPAPGGLFRYLENLRIEASLTAPPPEAAGAPVDEAVVLISSPKGSTFVVGEEISFSAKGSRSRGAYLREFLWDFGDGHRAWGSEVRHRYRTPGLYRVVLTVRDADGRPFRAERLLRIVPPELTPDFTWEPEAPTILDEVCFIDLSHGGIVSWHWDFGDGATSSAREPCHQYAERGEFQVTLTVTDSYGNAASVTKTLTVVNIPPHADPGGPYQGVVYTEIVFSAASSYDPDGEIVEYRWEFGDGTTGAGETVAHAYLKPGTYEVCLTVVDDAGAEARACTVAEVVYYCPGPGGTR